MRQFVSKREHLRCLAVGPIDEEKRRMFVDKYETAELAWIEFTTCSVTNDSVNDNEDSCFVNCFAQGTQRGSPCSIGRSPVSVDTQYLSHAFGH